MNPETVTIDDCLDMLNFKNEYTIIQDGEVIGFGYEHDKDISNHQSCLMNRRRL